ncbi:5-oxoprolinase subunit PxpA [Snuella sedimenti]|uniref:5-oxoprolinase subunit PxpA n=1 Tax=Snuella sedimenti TaxID=2798802 RepID=A0A8J7LPV3_9FLAO|nr:5-oxoprolinase subunit PxpA [Snuella sedimenti]MBJ6369868.1 5-oxoprolinase subunit PxpA [Snuella sedimenti]
MERLTIDMNADVGEGVGNEPQLLPYLSSCNIACGGHAGDKTTMRKVVALAQKHGVKVGAHPSFPDRANFGRVAVDMSSVALFTSIKEQIDTLLTVLDAMHEPLHHIKPHGALYNLAAVDTKIANVIIEVMKSIALPVKLYVPYQSVIAKLALQNNIPILYEVFADRNYNEDLTLVSRTSEAAIIHEPEAVFKHVYTMINTHKVTVLNGKEIPIKADTICIHGDNPEALSLVKHLRVQLERYGIAIH